MIATRTPFRVTLGGGGTDLPNFYREHGGFVFSMAIDRYMYVMVNPRPIDQKVRLLYTKSETADTVNELKHELAREALKFHRIYSSIEVASLADLPAGTGMGSSSTYLIGLLNAIRAYLRIPCSMQELAEEACRIELEILNKPIGKQDQYIAAFGGISILRINQDGQVDVERLHLKPRDLARLLSNIHIYYTGHHRDALEILSEQSSALGSQSTPDQKKVMENLCKIKELGERSLKAIREGRFDDYGQMLHEHWMHKKGLSSKVSLPWIDEIYQTVRSKFGVIGGKIIGAGGGGFLLLYTPDSHHDLEKFMESKGLPRLWYGLDLEGSSVITHVSGNHSEVDHTYRPQ